MTRLYPLFSGSTGNCYYLGSQQRGILIDAGRSAKQIENALKDRELDAKNISAVFITHEHSDHIQGVKVFAARYGMKVYASEDAAAPVPPAERKDTCRGSWVKLEVCDSHIDSSGNGLCDVNIVTGSHWMIGNPKLGQELISALAVVDRVVKIIYIHTE